MKIKIVTKKIENYISDDGKDFGEDKAACELYEFNNSSIKFVKDIPKINNVLFFHDFIDGYWCESQEDINHCCKYFQEMKREENLKTKKRNKEMDYKDCICNGRFLYPGYYFIIKINSSIIDSYAMYSLDQLKNLWDVFITQIPVNPKALIQIEDFEEIEKEYNKKHNELMEEDKKNNNIDITPDKIFQEIKEDIKEEKINDNKKNNTNDIMNKTKDTLKIYTSDNIEQFKKDLKGGFLHE